MKHLKIDVGLSENAPQSQEWIERDPDTFVIGFEPVSQNRERIQKGDSRWPKKLDPKFINSRIYIVPCALFSSAIPSGKEIFVTKGDPGCSSLLNPLNFETAYKELVPVWTLGDFLPLINPTEFPIVDHLKIDAQGADFEIVKGLGSTMNRVLAITIEVEVNAYESSTNDFKNVERFMHSRGFFRVRLPAILKSLLRIRRVNLEFDCGDPTFINLRLLLGISDRTIILYQRG